MEAKATLQGQVCWVQMAAICALFVALAEIDADDRYAGGAPVPVTGTIVNWSDQLWLRVLLFITTDHGPPCERSARTYRLFVE